MKLDRKQWIVFCVLLGLNALLAFIALALGLQRELVAGQEMSPLHSNYRRLCLPSWQR